MNLAEAIPVLIPRELPRRMAHRAMAVAPSRQPAIDLIFIRIYCCALGDRPPDQGSDRHLLDVRQHPDDDVARALDHPQDRRLLLCKPRSPFTRRRRPRRPCALTASGWPLCPAVT